FLVGAPGAAGAIGAGFAAAGGASGASVTTLGSGAISVSRLATSGGSATVSGDGFGLTIVAAGLISAGDSSSVTSAAFFDRAGPLTSSEPFSPLASDGGASITGPPRLLGAPRTATPRSLEVCTTPISSLASDGGAPAPRDPEVRTAIASSALASQGFLNAWVSRARASARPRHRSSAHT